MGFDKEIDFEEALVEELIRNGWSEEVILYPTEQDLINNWADILFKNNCGIDRLNDQPLTSGEMGQILNQIEDLKTPVALNGFINGETISITRDNPKDSAHFGKEVSLSIYNRLEIAGGKSRYQIVRQPKFERGKHILPDRRGDILLLINGMPVIHIELKRSGVSVFRAANQIAKYSHEGIFTKLFSLVQIFVAMTPEETIYFANPGMGGRFDSNFYFHWADFNNEPVNDWGLIASKLLSIPMAHLMIGFYTIADKGDGMLKVMRSYQYYAASAISNKVAKTDWSLGKQKGGYVWHTTGSGKTMTSFKSAQLIAASGDADKVVFLVDRIELGNQSLLKYRGFADAKTDVQDTDDTDVLFNKLKSGELKDTLIVTSIQKMSRVNVEEMRNRIADLRKIQGKRVVFIIDECHRSTFGDMLITIKNTFPRALFFGFTGTPIKDENQKNMNTTQTVFGESLHQYLLADGIRDKNVLGFDPHMVLTYKEADLRKSVALEKAKAQTAQEAFADENKKSTYIRYTQSSHIPMAGYSNEDGSYTKGIEDEIPDSQYNCDKHHKAVVEDIGNVWETLSQCGKFHAILATAKISEAIAYYKVFKEMLPELRVTALFDPAIDNNEGAEYKEDNLKEILEDYNATFGTKYTIPQHAAFKVDISLRLSHLEPYRNIGDDPKKQLNLLIVVNQMLTGFDSKWVNTLYIDKMLEYENVIQAFSRTNRLFGPDKPFGVIRYYRRPFTMERNIRRAVELYSDGKPVKLFADPLLHNLKKMNEVFVEIKVLFNNAGIKSFEKLPESNAEKGKFANLFVDFNRYFEAAKIQSFRWEKEMYELDAGDEKKETIKMLIDEHTYNVLLQRYKELERGGGGGYSDDVPYDIEPYLTEIHTEIIDDEYLNSRFEKYIKVLDKGDASADERKSVLEELHRSFASLSQEEQRFAKIFLNDFENGNVQLVSGKKFRDYVVEYQTNAMNDRIHQISTSLGVNEEQLRSLVNANVTKENINEYNRFSNLLDTVDMEKAKMFFEDKAGKSLSQFAVSRKLDEYLRDFVLSL